MKKSHRLNCEFSDPLQQFQELNRDNFASFGNLDSSQLEQLQLAQSQRSQGGRQNLGASQTFKSSDQFKNSTMQTAKYGGISVPTAEVYVDETTEGQNCVSSSHSIGQHAAYMDFPLQSPINIQTKHFNHSQSYPVSEVVNQQLSSNTVRYQSGLTDDTQRESVENLRSIGDTSSQGLMAGQKVMKNGKTYTVAGYKPTGASQTVASKPRKSSKISVSRVSQRNISNNSRLSAHSRKSGNSKISVSKKSKKSAKAPVSQQRSVSIRSRDHFVDTIKDIMKGNRNQNINLQSQVPQSKLSGRGNFINHEYQGEDLKLDSQRRTLEMRNQELTLNEALCSQAETLKADREVQEMQEMQEFVMKKGKDVCARNFINDAFDAVTSMEAVYQHPSKEELENQSPSQYQQQSLNMTLNQSEQQRMNFYNQNQEEEGSIPSTKPLSPRNQEVSKSVIYSQKSSMPGSSKSPEPRNYSQVLDQHNMEVSVVSPALISERCQVSSNNKYDDMNNDCSRDSQTQFMARTNSQRIQTQNTQRMLQGMVGSASANQTNACGVVRRNSCQVFKNTRGRQPQKVMIDYPQIRKKQRIKPQVKPSIPKHTRVETKYSMRRKSIRKNSSQGSRSRSNNSRIVVPSVASPPPQDTSTMYRRDSTFFGSSVGRDNSRETKRDLNISQSNMTISGIENKIYKDIQRAKEENRADQIYTFQPTSIQKPKEFGNGFTSFDKRQMINHDLINISSPGMGINASSIYPQSFDNRANKMMQSQDEDVKFVEFLKNVQLYLQQNESLSPKKDNGDHLYSNLQFLREKYKQFAQASIENQNQSNEFNYQKFREDFMETIKQCDMTNQATIKSDDKQQNPMLLSADVRSNDYPMLQTTLSQELGLKMMHSQSDVTMSARNYEMKLKKMTDEALKPTTVRLKSPPGQKIKSKSNERTKKIRQTERNKSLRKEETIQTMPDRQKKQIEFIDSIYKKVILKKDKRESQRQREASLQRKAKQVIDSINDRQQDRKQFKTSNNKKQPVIEEPQMQTLQSQESQYESSYQQYGVQTPYTFDQEEAQNSSLGRDQFSGYFQQPGTDQSSLQSQKNLNQPFKYESKKYREQANFDNSSLNQDLQILDSVQKHPNIQKFEEQIEVQKLQSHKYLKEIQDDLHDKRQKSLERSIERQRNMKEASFALQNLNTDDQRFQETYISSADMGTTQQTRGPFAQTHETALLINQKSSTQNVSIECSTQKGHTQGSTCELLDQVKIMQKNIGDPSEMSVNQINQTLQALNKTAQELKRACKGITDYANVLQQQQEQQINNIREEPLNLNDHNESQQNQSVNYSQDDSYQAQCQQFSEPYSGRCEAGTIDPYPQQIKTGYLTSYQELDQQCRDTFGQNDQQRYQYPQHKDSQTSYFFTEEHISATQSDNSRLQNQNAHQVYQQNLMNQRRDYLANDSMDSMAFTNSQDIVTRQSDLKILDQGQPSPHTSNMKQPPVITRRFVNSSGQSSQYIHTDKNNSQVENASNYLPEQDLSYRYQYMQKEISEPRLVTDKDALDSAMDGRLTSDYDIQQMQDRNSERFINTIQSTYRQSSNHRQSATSRPAPAHKTLEIDLEKTLQEQKAKSKALMAASYKVSYQMTSRQLNSLDHDDQTQKTSKHSGEPNMRYESQHGTIPVTDRTKFDFDNKSNTIRSYLYNVKDSIENVDNKSYKANQSDGSNNDPLRTYDYSQNGRLQKNSTQKEYLSPVSEEFQKKHDTMMLRENTLTPEEFEQAVLAQIKSDETQKGDTCNSNNLMDTKNLERSDKFYYDPRGYQPVHTEFSQTSQLKQKYIDQLPEQKNYNRTQEITAQNLHNTNTTGSDNLRLKDMPEVGSSSLLGTNNKSVGKQHYDTNQINVNTLDLGESKQAYADEVVSQSNGARVGAEFMPTYLLNTMKTSEFSAGQYGHSQIQDAFSFRDY